MSEETPEFKALERLVFLKHYKDNIGKTDYYLREQPKAWGTAQAIVAEKTMDIDFKIVQSVKPIDDWKEFNRIDEANGYLEDVEVIFDNGEIADYIDEDWSLPNPIKWRFKIPAPVKPVEGELKSCEHLLKLTAENNYSCINCKLNVLLYPSHSNPSLQSGVEEAANEYATLQGTHDKPEITAHDFKAGADWQAQQARQAIIQWVKASDHLPGFYTSVEWRNAIGGDIPLGKYTFIDFYKKLGPNIGWMEWLEKSPIQ